VIARNGIVRAGCWSHARRYLKQAFDSRQSKFTRFIDHLFHIAAIHAS
jgi:hypothetical protein